MKSKNWQKKKVIVYALNCFPAPADTSKTKTYAIALGKEHMTFKNG
jgi:poly-gamma-glutamate capsule biosynthesis protein CapA/YwtB (metallophosphatase superfamily)